MSNRGIKVYVSFGHGGSDPGASAYGLIEKELNLKVGSLFSERLTIAGFEVMQSRQGDEFKSLQARTDEANAWGADYYISIHHNAGGGDGFEVIHSLTTGEDDRLARSIAAELIKLNNPHGSGLLVRRGKNGDYYHEIRENLKHEIVAVIVEYAFLDSRDREAVESDPELEAEANAIFTGFINFIKSGWSG